MNLRESESIFLCCYMNSKLKYLDTLKFKYIVAKNYCKYMRWGRKLHVVKKNPINPRRALFLTQVQFFKANTACNYKNKNKEIATEKYISVEIGKIFLICMRQFETDLDDVVSQNTS